MKVDLSWLLFCDNSSSLNWHTDFFHFLDLGKNIKYIIKQKWIQAFRSIETGKQTLKKPQLNFISPTEFSKHGLGKSLSGKNYNEVVVFHCLAPVLRALLPGLSTVNKAFTSKNESGYKQCPPPPPHPPPPCRKRNGSGFSQDFVNSKSYDNVFFLMELQFSLFISYLQSFVLWKWMNPTKTRITNKREDFTQRMISKSDPGNPRVLTPLNIDNTGRGEEPFQKSF